MVSAKRCSPAILAALAIGAAAQAVAGAAMAGDCLEAIPEAAAKKVFDGLAKAKPGDGCTLENVRTEQSQMRIEWMKGGHLQEPILVIPSSCVSGQKPAGKSTLTAIVPRSVETACGEAAELTVEVVEADGAGELVKVEAPIAIPDVTSAPRVARRRPPRTLGLIGGGAALALAAGGGLVALRRRKRRAAPARAAEAEAKGGSAGAEASGGSAEAEASGGSAEAEASGGSAEATTERAEPDAERRGAAGHESGSNP